MNKNMKSNLEITQEIIAVVLEEVNGFDRDDAIEGPKEYNGEVEERILDILNKNYKQLC